jgi:hypothetical protein
MSEGHVPFALRSKLPATGTTIFTVMSALAVEHGAVNLGQGFPDYAIDPRADRIGRRRDARRPLINIR